MDVQNGLMGSKNCRVIKLFSFRKKMDVGVFMFSLILKVGIEVDALLEQFGNIKVVILW